MIVQIFDLPEGISLEDLENGFDEESAKVIHRVELRHRTREDKVNGVITETYERTGSGKIYCTGNRLKGVRIFGLFRVVEAFLPKVKRCYGCQRFGHIIANCNHPSRCVNCGGGGASRNHLFKSPQMRKL